MNLLAFEKKCNLYLLTITPIVICVIYPISEYVKYETSVICNFYVSLSCSVIMFYGERRAEATNIPANVIILSSKILY